MFKFKRVLHKIKMVFSKIKIVFCLKVKKLIIGFGWFKDEDGGFLEIGLFYFVDKSFFLFHLKIFKFCIDLIIDNEEESANDTE